MGGHRTVLLLAWLAICVTVSVSTVGMNDVATKEDITQLVELIKKQGTSSCGQDQMYKMVEKNFEAVLNHTTSQQRQLDQLTHFIKTSFSVGCSEADESGVSKINYGVGLKMEAYCQVDQTGKWTVIQKRTNGRLRFARDWKTYREGFGDLAGEFWLGNEYIHKLTAVGLTRLRVDLEDWDNTKHTIYYDTFMVAGEGQNYKLTVSGFSGSNPPGDALTYHSGMEFSTKDQDNDNYGGNCASQFGGGGWWYYACTRSNLNGFYNGTSYTGIHWQIWRGLYSLKATTMMLSKP